MLQVNIKHLEILGLAFFFFSSTDVWLSASLLLKMLQWFGYKDCYKNKSWCTMSTCFDFAEKSARLRPKQIVANGGATVGTPTFIVQSLPCWKDCRGLAIAPNPKVAPTASSPLLAGFLLVPLLYPCLASCPPPLHLAGSSKPPSFTGAATWVCLSLLTLVTLCYTTLPVSFIFLITLWNHLVYFLSFTSENKSILFMHIVPDMQSNVRHVLVAH
jgi:hypothetical protein